jgi:hypothetical protein
LTSTESDHGRCEIDNHADTCVLGNDCVILQDFERTVNVVGYDDSQGVREGCRTVTGAVAYDDPMSGEVIIIVIHQAIHIPTMSHNLLCPMQMRMNDVRVNEVPKFLTSNPTDETHAIVLGGNGDSEEYIIPLSLHGVTSYFPSRIPTSDEVESCRRYELTYESPEWDPQDNCFKEQEEEMVDSTGCVRTKEYRD